MNKLRTRKNGSVAKKHPRRIFTYFTENDTPYIEWGLNDEMTGSIRRRLPLQAYHRILQFQA